MTGLFFISLVFFVQDQLVKKSYPHKKEIHGLFTEECNSSSKQDLLFSALKNFALMPRKY